MSMLLIRRKGFEMIKAGLLIALMSLSPIAVHAEPLTCAKMIEIGKPTTLRDELIHMRLAISLEWTRVTHQPLASADFSQIIDLCVDSPSAPIADIVLIKATLDPLQPPAPLTTATASRG
jgi:hypothetical protein